MNFSALPRDERAAIVRNLAAEGKGRREIGRLVGSPPGSIDTLCADYRISTFAPPLSGGKHAHVHSGWELEGDALRAWFVKMDRRFAKAIKLELPA